MSGPVDNRQTAIATEVIAAGEALVFAAPPAGAAPGNAHVARQTTAGAKCDGVARIAASAVGDVISYNAVGHSNLLAGAAVAAGDDVTPNASARFVTAAAGNVIAGGARTAAAADGDTFEATIGRTTDGAEAV